MKLIENSEESVTQGQSDSDQRHAWKLPCVTKASKRVLVQEPDPMGFVMGCMSSVLRETWRFQEIKREYSRPNQ